jgi:hypothetical protein
MKHDTLRTLAACLGATLLGVASGARAVDGVLEINDASIVAAGGYPGAITAPGSYVLTGNLTPPPGINGLNVLAPDVTLDLNGFEIVGGGGGATGISNLGPPGLTVRNGSVTGFGTGISAGATSKIFHVHAGFNTGTGISGSGCLIVESTSAGNATGIQADRCKLEDNVVGGNSGIGIVGMSNVIVHNNVIGNGGGGILTLGGSTIQENVIQSNTVFGISDGIFGPPPPPPPPPMPSRNDVRGNTINNNGGAAGGPGVSLTMPSLINDNTVSGNTGSGVVCGTGCTLSRNQIDTNNTAGLPASGGAIVGPGGNVTDNSISFNLNFGLTISVFSAYSQNNLQANGFGGVGPNEIPVGGPIHPTSGFHNLCQGIVGPAPTCP